MKFKLNEVLTDVKGKPLKLQDGSIMTMGNTAVESLSYVKSKMAVDNAKLALAIQVAIDSKETEFEITMEQGVRMKEVAEQYCSPIGLLRFNDIIEGKADKKKPDTKK